MKYLVKHDFTKSQPQWGANECALYGSHNEGFVIEGTSGKDAFEDWNKRQLPGERINPFYVTISEKPYDFVLVI